MTTEKRYLGVDDEQHVPPPPNAKHRTDHPFGYIQPATEKDAKKLDDAIKQCKEADRKRAEEQP